VLLQKLHPHPSLCVCVCMSAVKRLWVLEKCFISIMYYYYWRVTSFPPTLLSQADKNFISSPSPQYSTGCWRRETVMSSHRQLLWWLPPVLCMRTNAPCWLAGKVLCGSLWATLFVSRLQSQGHVWTSPFFLSSAHTERTASRPWGDIRWIWQTVYWTIFLQNQWLYL